jgi:hypothetical protein
MSKHYIYNCLIKNDVNLIGLATLLSVLHFLCFYKQEGVFSAVIILIAALVSILALALSLRLRVVLNLRQHISSLILGSVVLSVISSIQYQTNDISSVFITVLGMVIIVFSGLNIKDILYTTKLTELPSADKKTMADYSISDVIALYKLKLYEVIRVNDDNELDRKYSLFFDYRINMIVDKYEMKTLDDGKSYRLHDFANYCKEHDINTSKMTAEDFEVFKMMII